ncbi:TRAP-type mannitol/chloroaromatic compound transport system, small permease component [Cohaesibacter sp. ES.047]|uniref:TRAP transporter small permease subunit n=1 Tax=Cohaesibacter sp. ES.047 TaxID=1798205 RepID=UPI000BB6E8DE|nr:TRAP transporter small permease [Cohaesibacter sp. ES.047]SNY89963.1 TRAP-type mannitol/chloroaromatic compound transport system, small permease component [Cohaesibacter sp. ES.047]
MSKDQQIAAPAAPSGTDGEARTPLDAAITWCGRGLAWLVFIAMAISVIEVISRYAFDSPTSWVHETVVFMIAILFAFGGPVAMAKDKHIRVRLIYDTVSLRARRWLDLFNSIITLFFAAGMSYAAYTMFWRASHNPLGEWSLERSGTSWNPPFPALTKGIILIALAIMTLQTLLHLYKSIRDISSNQGDDSKQGERVE